MTEKKETALSLIDNVNVQQVSATMQKISQFQAVVQGTLKQNHDYGIIPGTGSKPTLLKPGAEKILMLMGLTSKYEILEAVQDYDKGFFAYTVRCHLTKNGMTITQGLGHCNSRERKYTSDRQDIYMLGNTCLKMAKKRAQVDAALTIAALSEVFTQDLEDMDITGQRTESSYTPDVDNPAEVVLTFGKHKGKKLGDIPTGYVRWLAENARDEWLKEAASQVANGGSKEVKNDIGDGEHEQAPAPAPEHDMPEFPAATDEELASLFGD